MNDRINSFNVPEDASGSTWRETTPNVSSRSVVSRLIFLASLSICSYLIACAQSNDVPSPSAVAEQRFAGIEIGDSPTAVKDTNPRTEGQDPDTPRPDTPRQGGILLIEVEHCGIADPAIDIASHEPLNIFILVNETHAGLTRIVDETSLEVVPELAESFTVREDATLYEFTMRKELKFSDGSRLTASDVKRSWERALWKSTGNSRANDVFGDIIGAETVVIKDSQDLVGVEVVDENRLTVRLETPRPDFPLLIADPVAYVVGDDNIDDWGDAWINHSDFPNSITQVTGITPKNLPLGAGPFKVVEYAHPDNTRDGFAGEARCVLERNEHYWGNPSYLDGIIANVRPDLMRNYDANFERQRELIGSGDLDIAMHLSLGEIDMDDLPSGVQYYQGYEPPSVKFWTLNPAQPPLDDVHLRLALAKANNIGAAMRKINGAPNQMRLVPESVYVNGSDVSAFDFDIESAKSELATFLESAGIDSAEITIQSSAPPEFVFTGVYQSAILDVWRDDLGVNVDLQQLDLDNPIRFENLHITDHALDLYYPSPHGVLREFLDAMGEYNAAPEIVEIRDALTKAAATLDDAERLLRYEAIERRIIDDALVIPISAVEPYINLLLQPWVNGLSIQRYPSSVFQNVWLHNDAPARTTR